MTLLKLPLVPLLLALLLSSCSSDIDDTYTTYDRQSAEKVFNASSVTCSGECPSWAGGLVTYTEDFLQYKVSVCSQSLISENKILTNRHCLPEDLQESGKSCAGRIRILFPASGNLPAESVECEKVVGVSEFPIKVRGVRPDWAIVTLKRAVRREQVPVLAEGIDHDTALTSYPVYYDIDEEALTITGEIQEVGCASDMSSVVDSPYYDREASIVMASECSQSVIKGNSGAGLVDQTGSLRGVLSHIVELQNRSFLIAGSQLACIEGLSSERSGLCYFEESTKQNEFHTRYNMIKQHLDSDAWSPTPEETHIQWSREADRFVFDEDLLLGQAEEPRQLFAELLRRYHIPLQPECVSQQAPDLVQESIWIQVLVSSSEEGEYGFGRWKTEPTRRPISTRSVRFPAVIELENVGNGYIIKGQLTLRPLRRERASSYNRYEEFSPGEIEAKDLLRKTRPTTEIIPFCP